MDNKDLFSNKNEHYSKGRPAYSPQLISYLFEKVGFNEKSVVADIGSGTGIFAKQLSDVGSTVICVEPNADMRSTAQIELNSCPNIKIIDGNAESTGLPDASADFITAAQAFHWFDTDKFKCESKRILRKNGKAVLIWNTRDAESDISKENGEIFEKYCSRFKGFSGGIKKDDERIAEYFDGKYEMVMFDNPLVFDREKFINRCLSASYSLKVGDDEFDYYIKALNDLFDKFSNGGVLIMPNKTVAYIGQP